MNSKLPQSRFYKSITNEATKTLTLISASDDGITFGPETTRGNEIKSYPAGVNIFTEKLKLISKPGPDGNAIPALWCMTSKLNISTSNITTVGGADARISVDGGNGVLNEGGATAQDKVDAMHGNHSGDLNIYVQNLGEKSLRISLSASGGHGGENASTKAKGGNGGNGGCIQVYMRSNLSQLLALLNGYEKAYNLPDDWTDEDEKNAPIIDAGHPMLDDLSNILNAATSPIFHGNASQFTLDIENQLNPDIGQRTVFTITQAVNESKYLITKAVEAHRVDLIKKTFVTGGRSGRGRQSSRGLNGEDGVPGKRNISLVAEPNFKTVPTFVFAHPIQCNMLLEKAKAYFYFGDFQSRENAKIALESILEKLSFLENNHCSESSSTGGSVEEYLKVYANNRDILGLSPSIDIGTYLREILTETKDLYLRLTCTTIDYYGLREDWVPRTNPTAFNTEIKDALDTLKRMEEVYVAYTDALEDRKASSQHVSAIRGQVQSTTRTLDSQLKQLRESLKDLEEKIKDKAMLERLSTQRRSLLEKINGLDDEIRSLISVDPKSVIKAAEMIASTDNKAMAGIQGVSLAYEAMTTVPSDTGVPVSKELILGGLKKVSGSLKDIVKGVERDDTDGSFQLDVAYSKKMLVEQERLTKIFDDFTKSSFNARATDLKNSLEAYTALVVARNNKIVDYNLILKQIISSNEKKRKILEENIQLESQIFDGNDEQQIDKMTMFAQDMHAFNRSQVMKLLSYLKRSIYFSTLCQPNFLEIGGFQDESVLNLTHSQLESLKSKMQAEIFNLRESRGSDASRFPADYEKGRGKFVMLDSEQLSELLTNDTVDVTVPTVFADTRGESEFRGSANVRIYRVRFWLDGLRAKADASNNSDSNHPLVSTRITHSGSDVFVDTKGSGHAFIHDPLRVVYSYRLSPDGMTQPVDSGDLVNFSTTNPEQNTEYSAPGPFTTWNISLKSLNKSRLDFDGVTGGRLEFFGTSRSFDV